MAKWKKVVIGIIIMAIAAFAFLSWYKYHYSMEVARTFEVNSPALATRVLIATQGSDYKNAVVAGLVARLEPMPIYLRVIDVSTLPQINEADWNAIVLIHTWENLEAEAHSRQFVAGTKTLNKLIVLTTSGRGSYKIEGINAITSASTMSDVPVKVAEIEARLKIVLESNAER